MESVQKTDDGRLSEGSNPSASATALILCGIRAGEGFFFCFSLRISDSNGVNGRVFLMMPARLAMVLLGIPCSWRRRTVCIVTSILSVPRRYRSLYHSNCCTFIIQQNNKIVQKPKVPSFTTDSSVRNDIENTLILFRCNIPISRLCSANCGLDSYQSLKESVRKSNGRILLKGTNPSANVTISKVSDCS